jgi:hypothetical protein
MGIFGAGCLRRPTLKIESIFSDGRLKQPTQKIPIFMPVFKPVDTKKYICSARSRDVEKFEAKRGGENISRLSQPLIPENISYLFSSHSCDSRAHHDPVLRGVASAATLSSRTHSEVHLGL